ncbi:MAG: Holliday junction resolvase RuvX [Bacteriovoracaceae bacterium]|nr:Holliday junction resolvase RuvX [Bacteriovoracaceae bacterium]
MDLSQYPNFKRFSGRNILAVDFGTKVTGTATFCPGRDPFPLLCKNIIYQSDEDLIKEISELVTEEGIDVLILGLPLFTDGTESKMTQRVKEFAKLLSAKVAPTEFHLQDETLSSFEAEDRMKNSPEYNFKVNMKKIDMLAASIILEDFIKS